VAAGRRAVAPANEMMGYDGLVGLQCDTSRIVRGIHEKRPPISGKDVPESYEAMEQACARLKEQGVAGMPVITRLLKPFT